MKVVVWGLGTHGGGAAVTRYLHKRGDDVTVIDRASELDTDGLPDGVTVLPGVADPSPYLSATTLLIVNPAVPPSHAAWPAVRASGCPVSSEIALLLNAVGGRRVLAVTGSNGKSTVVAWTAAVLKTDAVGGNFECDLWGLPPLLDRVGDLAEDAVIVLELSSFQLRRLKQTTLNFAAAAVTNGTANHLDWHEDFAEYRSAKLSLLDRCEGVRVLPPDGSAAAYEGEPRTVQPTPAGPAEWPDDRRQQAGFVRELTKAVGQTVDDETLAATWERTEQPVQLPHRSQVVAETSAIRFVDDSAATSPEATASSLHRFGRDCVLIAGGRNKEFDLDAFARSIARDCVAVAAIGETASTLAGRLAAHGGKVRSHRTMAAAVKWAAKICPDGGTVLLSPGMASTDEFRDYRDRGRQFAEAAKVAADRLRARESAG